MDLIRTRAQNLAKQFRRERPSDNPYVLAEVIAGQFKTVGQDKDVFMKEFIAAWIKL